MPKENTTAVTAAVAKTMKDDAVKMAQKLGYVSLSDFISDAIRDKLVDPRGEPIPAARPEELPRAAGTQQTEADKP